MACKNNYLQIGQISVQLIFHNEERSLEEKLKAYFLALKQRETCEEARSNGTKKP